MSTSSPNRNSDITIVVDVYDRSSLTSHNLEVNNAVDVSVVTGENVSISALLGARTIMPFSLLEVSGQQQPCPTTLWDALTMSQFGYIIDATTEDSMTNTSYGERLGIGNVIDLADNNNLTSKKRKIDLTKLISEAIKIATEVE
jgi:hypothetical protein